MNCDSQVPRKDVSNLWLWSVSQSDIRDKDQDLITRQVLREMKNVEFIPHSAWHLYSPQPYHVQEGSWQGVVCVFLLEVWCLSGSCRASHADMVTRISIVGSHMGERAAYYIGARTSRARPTALGPIRC